MADDPEVLLSSKVAATIGLIRASIDTYLPAAAADDSGSGGAAFEEECDTFRRSMSGVADVLDDVKAELAKNPNSISAEKAGLDKPLELIRTAAREGGVVLYKCSSQQHKAVALVFTKQLMGTLDKARADVGEALRLLHFSNVKIHVATHRLMDSVSERLNELKRQIDASVARRNEVTDLLLLLHEDSGLRSTSDDNDMDEVRRSTTDVIRNSLVDMGAVLDAHEADYLMAELHHEAESIWNAKSVYDPEIVDAVLALIAPPTIIDNDDNRPGDEGTEATPSNAIVTTNDLNGNRGIEEGGGTHLELSEAKVGVDAERSLTIVEGTDDKSKSSLSSTSASETKEDEEAAHPSAATALGRATPSCYRSRWVKAAFGVVAMGVAGVVCWISISLAAKPSPYRPQSIQERFKSSLPYDTITSLSNTSSPQYRAYEWVMWYDQFTRREDPNNVERRLARMKQRFALATVFFSIDGLESWVNSTESECQWGYAEGTVVLCDADSRIVALNATSLDNYVSSVGNGSTLPPEVILLTGLKSLSLNSCGLTSSIPSVLGWHQALQYLDLGNNKLTSSIPTRLGRLSSLEYLNLFWNELTSTIPTELGKLSDLKYLNLGWNKLTSSIPTELGTLSALTYLSLYSNDLTSSIPTELSSLQNLEDVLLHGNSLTGYFPFDLCYVDSIGIDCSEVACTCCGC